jgi:dienelactone hydrolase
VLCYDKRGVGESGGTYVNVGTSTSEERFPLLAADMAAGARFLRSLGDIDGKRIGLVGNSQAGWIIPIAAREARPAFMIILVGPTVSVGEEMYYSEFAEKTTTPLEKLAGVLTKFKGPHGFDPRPVLSTLDVPGLWLLGAEDRSIPTPETVAILDGFIRQGRPFAHIVYPFAGHDLTRTADIWPDVDRWLATLAR